MPENTAPTSSSTSARPAASRSPFTVDLRELGRRPGSMRSYRRSVPAPAGLGLDLIGVPDGAPLDLEFRLESVTEGVLVTGAARAPVTGQCGRCLDPLTDEVDVEFRELFAYPNSVTDETTEADEILRIDGDLLDVEPVVRDAVVLGLPWTPLCRPDCAGLCPQCGQRLDDLPPGHAHDTIDPRWAALAARTDITAADSPGSSGGSGRTTDEE